MDVERAVRALDPIAKYLETNDFESIFKELPRNERSNVYEFLIKELGIDPLPYMETIFEYMFANVALPKLYLPDNIEKLDKQAFVLANIDKVKLNDKIVSIPQECFGNAGIKQIFLPESVKRLGKDAFIGCNDDIIIVTPWRERKIDKLSIPTSDIDFYKAHLKFQHKPQDEPVLDGTNQGEDA